MNVGSLFSGIGGFDLGLERAGMRTVWFCESDAYCQRVLNAHFPDVPCFPNVQRLRGGDVERPDVLCGGFPCQDLSVAGKGAGLDGSRSGLWSEYARLIGELRPRYVIVENVPALLARGFGRVLGDLAALGYDAEWDCLPASAFGAPHRRDRVWIIAYPASGTARRQAGERPSKRGAQPSGDGTTQPLAYTKGERFKGSGGLAQTVHPEDAGWATEPNVGRVANGVPHRVDRLRSLGNALVPAIAEWIGRRIMEHEANRDRTGEPLPW